ncbi:amidohydrolase family protein [Pseudonocardia xishanensis]|uniref:Amidohydrolase-related domain-containing protein n=1 Tax=Pseudonocardia xishanensis TaxID=630995 RepID=A0ABP8RXQ3_9PSEU
MEEFQKYTVISADCHAGAEISTYRRYLEAEWHSEFDDWVNAFSDPWVSVDADPAEFTIGVASASSSANWDSGQRMRQLEDDGIVAEVIFPNTTPPFFPSGVFTAAAPSSRREYERRWAGLRAHNRWLAEFCSDVPGRRAGVAQVFLNDVDDAVAEVRWAKEAGLTGGILLPADSLVQLAPVYHASYDPLWAVCAELGMPVHRHASLPGDPTVEGDPAITAIGLIEGRFFTRRALAHLVFGGVFDRFPTLMFVLTEAGIEWVPAHLRELDAVYGSARMDGTLANTFAGAAANALRRRPSEYLATNCYLGASFMSAAEAPVSRQIGVDRVMWGSDYPHSEGTYPFSIQALQMAFGSMTYAETRSILTDTPATVYGFDRQALEHVADRVGPRVDAVHGAPMPVPRFPEESLSPAFSGAVATGRLPQS